jgi:apolipoprotein N-acyltransferase
VARRGRSPWGRSDALALASALPLAALGYDQPQLAWIAFVPLLLGVRSAALRRGALLGFGAGWGFEVGTTTWFVGAGVSLPAYLVLTAFCALRFAVLGALATLPVGAWRLALLPGTWVALEYLRLHQGPFSTAWGLIGYSQASFLPAARLAAWGGIYGVSFAILAVNVALAETIAALRGAAGVRPALRVLAPSLAVLALVAALVASRAGVSAVSSTGGADGALRVVAVQGGVHRGETEGQAERVQLVERYRRMSREAVNGGADLVVWPEASFPASIPADATAMRALAGITRELDAPLLLAASGADKTNRSANPGRAAANSAFLLAPGGALRARYDKVRLLPFNEYVPLRGLVRWPEWIVSDLVDAVPGHDWTRFELGGYRFAVLICWENLFPHDFRAASEGADFVVSLTNEAFTQSRVAHRQLLDMNRLRAIESGVWVVRAATTAESAAIAPSGELVARVAGPDGDGADALGTLALGFVPARTPTLYQRFGDWIVALQALVLPAVLIGHARARRRAR